MTPAKLSCRRNKNLPVTTRKVAVQLLQFAAAKRQRKQKLRKRQKPSTSTTTSTEKPETTDPLSAYPAPTDVNITLLPNATIEVNWNLVTHANHSAEYFFIEYLKINRTTKKPVCKCKLWHKCTDDMPTEPYSYMAAVLEPNYDYRFRVAAYYDKDHTVYCNTPSRVMKLRMKVIKTTPISRKRRRKMTTPIPDPNATTIDPRLGKFYEQEASIPPTWPPDDELTTTEYKRTVA